MIVAGLALLVVCAGVLIVVLITESTHRKEVLSTSSAEEALATAVATAALRVDQTVPSSKEEPSWIERLFVAQVVVREGLHALPPAVKSDVRVDRWARVELDVCRARSWEMVEMSQRESVDDAGASENLKRCLEGVVSWHSDMADNLELLRAHETDVDVAETWGSLAEGRLVAVYESNGWPLLPATAGSRWPGDSRSVLEVG